MKLVLPEIVVKHANRFFAGLFVLLRKEAAPGSHVDAEAGEIIPRGQFTPDKLRPVASGHAEGKAGRSHDFGKARVLRRKILPLRRRESLDVSAAVRNRNVDGQKPIGLVDRHGPQQIRVYE